MVKVSNISNLSPTYLVSNIRHQHLCNLSNWIHLQEKRALTDVSLTSNYENEYLKILGNKIWLVCTFALICETYLITAIISYGIKLRVSVWAFLAIKFLRDRLSPIVYCEILKMAFPKILDFRRGLKTRSEAPKDISKDWESQNCDWVLFSITRFLISPTP